MFGFVVANIEKLSQENRERYSAVYCGLCRTLGDAHGTTSRLTLTYDMTFLILLLSSLDRTELAVEKKIFCALHPTKRRSAFINRHTRYAADINLLLAYYQRMDDWADEKKLSAYLQSKALSGKVDAIQDKYPRQTEGIQQGLKQLEQLEQAGEPNPDLPAAAFGKVLGEVFSPEGHPHKEALFSFGEKLGRFIYLIDAVIDMKQDLQHERYNPLVGIETARHEEILQVVMADCVQAFQALPVIKDLELMENILYSGIWTRYIAHREGANKV